MRAVSLFFLLSFFYLSSRTYVYLYIFKTLGSARRFQRCDPASLPSSFLGLLRYALLLSRYIFPVRAEKLSFPTRQSAICEMQFVKNVIVTLKLKRRNEDRGEERKLEWKRGILAEETTVLETSEPA